MQEDLKNLEEIINLSKEEIENNDENITAILDLEDLKALQNLLTRYKQLEEENKEIKKEFAINTEIHKRDEIIKDLKETINCLHETDKENYIPKSKVKEKIEEYEKSYIDDPEGFRKAHFRVAIVVMKDLLREE